MKKLTVISMEYTAVSRHVAYLRSFFENRILVEGYHYLENKDFPKMIRSDLVLLTSQELTAHVRENINTDAQIIYADRTLLKKQIDIIRNNELSGKVMLVDYSEETATRFISLLTKSGIRDIELLPVGRDTSTQAIAQMQSNGAGISITAGLSYLVPDGVAHTIDIGWAPLDARTMLEISVILDIYNESIERKLFYYMQTLITSENNIMFSLKNTIDAKNIYKTIMDLMEYGVLITDHAGKVRNWNKDLISALKIAAHPPLTPEALDALLPETLRELIAKDDILQDKMVFFPELKQDLIITKLPIRVFNKVEGTMLTVKEIPGIARKNANIRRQMQRSTYRAKHTFEDIVGSSEELMKSKRFAKKIAEVDATILITGESGTGKELFAQSIHNVSSRNDMPFVAINCAAISPTLLESELFGYEKGAFTGACSDGHIGVFELAHRGTLFLDEVGELTLDVQAKLLRVLEEREVRRVGGEVTIPIDVRIIAATNKDLLGLCREKRFRSDLFYRLNILPLHLAPLRERKEDILQLAKRFLSELNAEDKLMTPHLEEALVRYRWDGNGRELHNCVQYMTYMSEHTIGVEHLPEYIQQELSSAAKDRCDPLSGYDDLSKDEKNVLLQLNTESVGREALTAHLQEHHIQLSEYRVRQILRHLSECGYVIIHRGRSGIELTPKGKSFLDRSSHF